jgi:hypothetical protein
MRIGLFPFVPGPIQATRYQWRSGQRIIQSSIMSLHSSHLLFMRLHHNRRHNYSRPLGFGMSQ